MFLVCFSDVFCSAYFDSVIVAFVWLEHFNDENDDDLASDVSSS